MVPAELREQGARYATLDRSLVQATKPNPRRREESNSKLLNDSLERKPVLPLGRRQQTLLHPLRPQEVRGFPLRGNLPPQFDGNDYSRGLPGLIGDDLDVCVRHNFSLPPE